MARAAAVHLNGSRFEAIVLEGTAKRWKIAGFEAGDIPAPEEGATPGAAVAATVAAALKKVHAPHDPVCLTIGSSGVVFRNLTLPFTGDDAIRKVLKFESEGLLHQYNIDDVVVCHVTVAERKGASDLLIAAAPKKLLKAQIDPLEAVGYDPALVDLDALTLFNALVATGSVPATGTSLVLHVGQDSTLALLVEEGRLRFARSMRAGLGSVGRAAAADLGVPEVEAQARVRELAAKSDAGSSVGAEVEEVFVTFDEASSAGDAKTATNAHSETAKSSEELARDVVDGRRADLVKRLQRETVRTAAAEARHGLQQVFLCGEGAGLAGLAPAIEEAVGVPTREIDCLANVDGAPEGAELRRQAPIVLGAALKPIGIDHTATDFRQEELRFTRKLEALKLPLAVLVGAIAFFLLLQNIYVYRENERKTRTLVNIAGVAAERVKHALPKEPLKSLEDRPPRTRIAEYKSKLSAQQLAYKSRVGGAGSQIVHPQSAFDAMHRVFQVFQNYKDDLGLFVLDTFDATSGERPKPTVTIQMGITFLGEDDSASARIELFRAKCKEQKWCVDVPIVSSEPVPGGRTVKRMTVLVDLSRETAS